MGKHGAGNVDVRGYLRFGAGGKTYAHRALAEKALRKSLPKGAEVHHFYGDKSNNDVLVICPDAAYHKLLHRRQEALKNCGNANWHRCQQCKTYDDPKNLLFFGNKGFHRKRKGECLR